MVALLLAGMLLSGCVDANEKDAPVDTPAEADFTAADGNTAADGETTSDGNTAAPPATGTNTAPAIGAFTFNATDADGDDLTYTLAFGGNETNATGALVNGTGNATHLFAAAGSYNVTLTISDGKLSVNRSLALNLTAGAVNTATQTFTAEWLVGAAGCGIVLLAPDSEGDGVIGDAVAIDPAIRGQKFKVTFEETPDSIGYDMFWLNDGSRDDGTAGPAIQGIVPDDATGASFRNCGAQGTTATFTAGPDVY